MQTIDRIHNLALALQARSRAGEVDRFEKHHHSYALAKLMVADICRTQLTLKHTPTEQQHLRRELFDNLNAVAEHRQLLIRHRYAPHCVWCRDAVNERGDCPNYINALKRRAAIRNKENTGWRHDCVICTVYGGDCAYVLGRENDTDLIKQHQQGMTAEQRFEQALRYDAFLWLGWMQFTCRQCNKDAHPSREALDAYKEVLPLDAENFTDVELVNDWCLCLSCACDTKRPLTGEHALETI